MTHLKTIKTGVCLAALMSGSAAMADVTAAEVWENWKGNMALYGEDGITIGSEDVSGDTVTVSGLMLSVEEDGTKVEADLGTMIFTENGDGTVAIEMPATYPISIMEGPDNGVKMSINQTGLSITASGTPGAISYDVTANQYGIQIDEILDAGNVVEGDARLVANGIAGNYTVTEGEVRNFDYGLTMDSADILVDVAAPEDDAKILMSGKINGLFVDAQIDLPEGLDFEQPESIFASDFAISANYGLQSGDYLFDINEGNDEVAGTASTGVTAVNVALDRDGILYDVLTNDLALAMQVPDLPFPVDVSAAQYGISLMMPLSKTEGPTDFSFGVTLAEISVNDEIWMLGDPTGALSHDPITIKMAVSGMAKLFFDLTNPEEAAAIDAGAIPGEIYSLDLDVLDVRAAGATVDGTGGFTFDNSDMQTIPGVPRPEGEVTININGANALIDSLVQMGLLPEDQAMMGRMMMGMFARTVGDDQLTSTIEVNEQGHVLANGQRIQ